MEKHFRVDRYCREKIHDLSEFTIARSHLPSKRSYTDDLKIRLMLFALI